MSEDDQVLAIKAAMLLDVAADILSVMQDERAHHLMHVVETDMAAIDDLLRGPDLRVLN
jgi:hypothetical protein